MKNSSQMKAIYFLFEEIYFRNRLIGMSLNIYAQNCLILFENMEIFLWEIRRLRLNIIFIISKLMREDYQNKNTDSFKISKYKLKRRNEKFIPAECNLFLSEEIEFWSRLKGWVYFSLLLQVHCYRGNILKLS